MLFALRRPASLGADFAGGVWGLRFAGSPLGSGEGGSGGSSEGLGVFALLSAAPFPLALLLAVAVVVIVSWYFRKRFSDAAVERLEEPKLAVQTVLRSDAEAASVDGESTAGQVGYRRSLHGRLCRFLCFSCVCLGLPAVLLALVAREALIPPSESEAAWSSRAVVFIPVWLVAFLTFYCACVSSVSGAPLCRRLRGFARTALRPPLFADSICRPSSLPPLLPVVLRPPRASGILRVAASARPPRRDSRDELLRCRRRRWICGRTECNSGKVGKATLLFLLAPFSGAGDGLKGKTLFEEWLPSTCRLRECLYTAVLRYVFLRRSVLEQIPPVMLAVQHHSLFPVGRGGGKAASQGAGVRRFVVLRQARLVYSPSLGVFEAAQSELPPVRCVAALERTDAWSAARTVVVFTSLEGLRSGGLLSGGASRETETRRPFRRRGF